MVSDENNSMDETVCEKVRHFLLLCAAALALLSGLLLSGLTGLTAQAAVTDEPQDRNRNGRIDEGYIFLGESHICMSRLGFDLYHADRDGFVYEPSKHDDEYADPDNFSDKANIFFVTSQNLPDAMEDDFLYRNGAVAMTTIIQKHTEIEHWNIILGLGTNLVGKHDMRHVEEGSAFETMQYLLGVAFELFPGTPTSVYVMSAPYVLLRKIDPDTNRDIGMMVYDYDDQVKAWMTESGWGDYYIDNRPVYEKYIMYMYNNEYLTDGTNQALLFTDWDGVHYTAKIYYEAMSAALDQVVATNAAAGR